MDSEIINDLKSKFPKLFIKEITTNDLKFEPEVDEGSVEYKRTLANCTKNKIEKYASQMIWRINENFHKQCATYFIGVDDNGAIIGLSNDDIIACVTCFVSITKSIEASISAIHIIHVKELSIIKIGVRIKKLNTNFLVEFDESAV